MSDSDDDGNEMHRQVEWLTRADVSVLEFLHAARDTRGNPSIQTPTTIASNTGYDPSYIGERCRHLVEHDLAERVERGKYRLSETGEALMNGGIQPKDLENSP